MSKFGILYECSMPSKKEIQQVSDNRDSLLGWIRNKGKLLEERVFVKWRQNGFTLSDDIGTYADYSVVRFAEKSDVIKALQQQLLDCSNEELEYLYSRYSKERIKINE